MKFDYIIVGQGIAGSAVAVQLMRRNKSILVFDEPAKNNSSRIAAGLFNPLTGKKMVKTWMADMIFPYLQKFYTTLEEECGSNFFHPLPMYRPFLSFEDQNEWAVKSTDAAFSTYVRGIFFESINKTLNDKFGGLLLQKTGFLDTAAYVDAVARLIQKKGNLQHEIFEPQEIIFTPSGVTYRQYHASKVIFCSGVHKSSYFSWLPVRALKGETLTIRTTLPEEMIINRGAYLVPEEQNNLWKVGSTYYFHDRTEEATEAARQELEEKIVELIHSPFEVVDHRWGFRPTTPDRRPILGAHPEHDALVAFNGLGTKGVSLAPYFSEVLVRWLEKEGSIHKEVDIERYKSVYSGSPK